MIRSSRGTYSFIPIERCRHSRYRKSSGAVEVVGAVVAILFVAALSVVAGLYTRCG